MSEYIRRNNRKIKEKQKENRVDCTCDRSNGFLFLSAKGGSFILGRIDELKKVSDNKKEKKKEK